MMGSGSAFEVFGDIARTKKRRSKRKVFDHNKRYYQDDGIENVFPAANPNLLKQIRDRVQEQQRQSQRKTIIIFSIVGIFLISVLFYFLFVHQFSNEVPSIFQFGW